MCRRDRKKMIHMLVSVLLIGVVCVSCTVKSENASDEKYRKYADMTAEEIVDSLTLEQKADQMVMAACYDISPRQMKKNCYGCILSVAGEQDYREWQKMIDEFQQAAVKSEAGIPYFYGNDEGARNIRLQGCCRFPA